MFRLKSAIISHIIGWIIFLSLPLLFLNGNSTNENKFQILFSANYFLFCIAYIFLFYFNTYFLIPQFYLQKKFFIYFIIILLLLIIFYLLKPFDQLVFHANRPPTPGNYQFQHPPSDSNGPSEFRPGRPFSPDERASKRIDVVSIFLFIMVWALSMAVKITQQWRKMEQRATRAEADKANAELSFLKTQINPHFLFNTLNNIYTLAITRNENTAACLMKLSNIMRYVTDEVSEDFVMLANEVNCIRDYIDLQRLRLGKNMKIDFEVTGEMENRKIPPLILMTFVENLFKYGVSNHEAADIIIKIFSDKKSITFFSKNRVFVSKSDGERGGIGITNARKRLDHLYPNKHFFNIESENGWYILQLTLQNSL
ncbi:MAG TPA: sensor histidine kinase [Puia sp.]|nr:sensor histidine kinase [Puia sp.]